MGEDFSKFGERVSVGLTTAERLQEAESSLSVDGQRVHESFATGQHYRNLYPWILHAAEGDSTESLEPGVSSIPGGGPTGELENVLNLILVEDGAVPGQPMGEVLTGPR